MKGHRQVQSVPDPSQVLGGPDGWPWRYLPTCECGWQGEACPASGSGLIAKHAAHAAEMLDELRRYQRDYYTRTGHCGACGQPGTFCLCTDRDPCGCRGLHRMGSGLDADPVEVFAAVPVGDDQGELFS